MDNDTKGGPARVAAKSAVVADEKFVEVELVKKYVPHHCYELVDGIAMLQRDDKGVPLLQKNVELDPIQDKFGQPKRVFREILQSIPPGTRIEIPRSEALTLINAGKAQISARSFE